MTETDAVAQPLGVPPAYMPFLDRNRIYQLFKDMVKYLLVKFPKDHLMGIKAFLFRQLRGGRDSNRIMLLVSPELNIDKKELASAIVKDMGYSVLTRAVILDFYVKDDEYVPGYICPPLLAKVTKDITLKHPVPQNGWLMIDNPCTLREAKCMQREGIYPNITLTLVPPLKTTSVVDPQPPQPRYVERGFYEQDFEGLKQAYWATLKEVIINQDDTIERIKKSCFNAIRAMRAGVQGPGQGYHVVGSPGVYRVLLVGPIGAGRRTQAELAVKDFHLVKVHFNTILQEAMLRKDELSEALASRGTDRHTIEKIINRRLLKQDCMDFGWIMTGFPKRGIPLGVIIDDLKTPPNRIIFINVDRETCEARMMSRAIDHCTGKTIQTTDVREEARAQAHPEDTRKYYQSELEFYFSDALDDLKAAAGINASFVDGTLSVEQVHVQVQAAIMAAPIYEIENTLSIESSSSDSFN